MNNFFRALISLCTVLPLSITFSYLYADWLWSRLPKSWCELIGSHVDYRLFLVSITCILNVLIGKSALLFLNSVAHKHLDVRPISIISIKELGSDSLLAYLPYVLPLFIVQGDSQGVTGWLLGTFLLFILSWVSMSVAFSPLLRLLGLRFFEANLEEKRSVILLVKGSCIEPLEVSSAATITDNCYYGLS